MGYLLIIVGGLIMGVGALVLLTIIGFLPGLMIGGIGFYLMLLGFLRITRHLRA